MSKNDGSKTASLPISTECGVFTAHYSELGLCRLEFPHKSKAPARNGSEENAGEQISSWHRMVSKALSQTLSGKRSGPLPPLDLSCGTEFQQQVWQSLLKIGTGKTWSYSDVARDIGRPKALRAVGNACGANPIPVLIPCHRVLAAGNAIGGFSSGLEWKRRLLARERVFLPGLDGMDDFHVVPISQKRTLGV